MAGSSSVALRQWFTLPFRFWLFFHLLVCGSSAWGLEKGATAPDFALPTLDGGTARLSDQRGKVIVLKLGTTWCATCGEQEEELGKVAARLGELRATIVDVFLQEDAESVRAYLKRKKRQSAGVVLLDDDRARKAYGVYLIPRLIVIDRSFRIVRDGGLMLGGELVETVRKAAGGGG